VFFDINANFAPKREKMKRIHIVLITLAIGFSVSLMAQHKQSAKKTKKADSTKVDSVLKIRVPPLDSIPIGNAKDAA
jgi:hypothetical protein